MTKPMSPHLAVLAARMVANRPDPDTLAFRMMHLDNFGLDYVQAPAQRGGAHRKAERLAEHRQQWANTPVSETTSRQVRRQQERSQMKALISQAKAEALAATKQERSLLTL